MSRARIVLERLYAEQAITAARDGRRHQLFPTSIPAPEGESLRMWIEREKAERTVEVGFGYGVSALWILDALMSVGRPDPRHVVIDPNQASEFADCGHQVIADAGLTGLLDAYAESSQLALPRMVSDARNFDLAFVDGNHRFEFVFVDLFFLDRLVRPSGVIFLDDYQLPGVAKAVAFWAANAGWHIEEQRQADEDHAWVVARLPDPPIERDFDVFADF